MHVRNVMSHDVDIKAEPLIATGVRLVVKPTAGFALVGYTISSVHMCKPVNYVASSPGSTHSPPCYWLDT